MSLTQRTRRAGLVAAGVTAIALAFSGCTASTPTDTETVSPTEPFVIGGVLPLSGANASFGEYVVNVAEMVKQQMTESGELGEHTLEFQWEDGVLDPQTSLIAFQRLEGKMPVVLSAGSSTILAQLPEAERTETLLVNFASQPASLYGVSDWLFNAIPSSNAELEAIVALAQDDLGEKTLAILHSDSDQGVNDTKVLNEMWTEAGGEVVGEEAFAVGATDMRTALTRIRDTGADALFITGTISEIGYATAQVAELGLDVQLLGRTQNIDPQVFTIAGDAVNGLVGAGVVLRPSNPSAEAFIKDYTDEFGKAPSLYAAVAYDAIHIVLQAYLAVGTDSVAVRDYIASNITDFSGVMGSISVGSDLTASYPIFTYEVKDGEVVDFSG